MNLKGGYIIPESDLKGEIEFNDVFFYYPTRKQQVCLPKIFICIYLYVLDHTVCFEKIQFENSMWENSSNRWCIWKWQIYSCCFD